MHQLRLAGGIIGCGLDGGFDLICGGTAQQQHPYSGGQRCTQRIKGDLLVIATGDQNNLI